MSMWGQRGFSVIQVVISIGLLGVLGAVFAEMVTSQNKNVRALNQKIDILEFRQALVGQFTRSEVCSWQLAGKEINVSSITTKLNPSPTKIEFQEIYMGQTSSSPILAKKGEFVFGGGHGVKIQKIQLSEIYSTGIPNEYIGTLEVEFDSTNAVIPLRAVTANILFLVDPATPAAARSIISCLAKSGGTESGFGDYFTERGIPNLPSTVICSKAADKKWTHVLRLSWINPTAREVFYVNALQADEKSNYVVYNLETGNFIRVYNSSVYFEAATCPEKIEFGASDIQWKK